MGSCPIYVAWQQRAVNVDQKSEALRMNTALSQIRFKPIQTNAAKRTNGCSTLIVLKNSLRLSAPSKNLELYSRPTCPRLGIFAMALGYFRRCQS